MTNVHMFRFLEEDGYKAGVPIGTIVLINQGRADDPVLPKSRSVVHIEGVGDTDWVAIPSCEPVEALMDRYEAMCAADPEES